MNIPPYLKLFLNRQTILEALNEAKVISILIG